MIRRIRLAVFVSTATLAVSPAASRVHGQSVPARDVGGGELRLGALYARVRDANPRMLAARALASASRFRIGPARSWPDPQLQLGFMNYQLPSLAPMDAIGMAQLQVMQMIPIGGKPGLSGRVAESQAVAFQERSRSVEWDVRAQAAMAFYDVFRADRALDVARGTLRLLQDILRTVESMYRVGEG